MRDECPSTSGLKCLHFHAVFRKNWPNNGLAPSLWGWHPSSGKSCICHCFVNRAVSGWFQLFVPKCWARGRMMNAIFHSENVAWVVVVVQVADTPQHNMFSPNLFKTASFPALLSTENMNYFTIKICKQRCLATLGHSA